MDENPKPLLKNNFLLWCNWERMKPPSKGVELIKYYITVAGIWLSATGDLNPAEPDIIRYHWGGFPEGQTGAWRDVELMKTTKMGGGMSAPTVGDKAGDSWEICGLGFMRMQQPLGNVLIWFVC